MKNERALYQREILDLYEAAYHASQLNLPKLELKGSRVFFTFADSEAFRRIDSDFHANKPVGVLDFSGAVRRLRSEMLALKDDAKRGGRQ